MKLSSNATSEMSQQCEKGSQRSLNNQQRSRAYVGRQPQDKDRDHETLLTSSLPTTPSFTLGDSTSSHQSPVKRKFSTATANQQQAEFSLSDYSGDQQINEESLLGTSSSDDGRALLRSKNSSTTATTKSWHCRKLFIVIVIINYSKWILCWRSM